MSYKNKELGRKGEDIAVTLLKQQGYRLIARNYTTKLGEIDIIASEKDTICFVEVKSRTSKRFGLPIEAVSLAKQKQIARVAWLFLKENNLLNRFSRFDVVSVMFKDGRSEASIIKGAFEI